MEIIVVCFVEKDYIKQHIGIMLGLAHDFVLYFCIYGRSLLYIKCREIAKNNMNILEETTVCYQTKKYSIIVYNNIHFWLFTMMLLTLITLANFDV